MACAGTEGPDRSRTANEAKGVIIFSFDCTEFSWIYQKASLVLIYMLFEMKSTDALVVHGIEIA